VSMYRAIAAKNQDGIGAGGVGGQPKLPERIRDSRKGLKMFGRRIQTENRGDSHAPARLTNFNQRE
jgi:hypothetical protein